MTMRMKAFSCLGVAIATLMRSTWTLPTWAHPSTEMPLILATELRTIPPLGDRDEFLPLIEQRLVLDLSDRRVYLYHGDELIAAYPVAVGRDGWETPTGEFAVFQKVINPVWQHPFTGEVVPPGPDNPLGARWLGFWTDGTNAIGFHGTPHEELIGQAVSHGCVRMRNADIERLFEQVEMGTIVIVRS